MSTHVPKFKHLDAPEDIRIFQNCVNVCTKMKLVVREKYEYEIVDLVVHLHGDDDVYDSRLNRRHGCWSVKLEDRPEDQWIQYIDINISPKGIPLAYRPNGIKNMKSSKTTPGSSNIVDYFQNNYDINISDLDERKINKTNEFKIVSTPTRGKEGSYLTIPRYSKTFRVNKLYAREMAFKPYRVVKSDSLKELIKKDCKHIVYLHLMSQSAHQWTSEEIHEILSVTPRQTKKWINSFLEGLDLNFESFNSISPDGKVTSIFDQCRLYGAWCEKYLKRAV